MITSSADFADRSIAVGLDSDDARKIFAEKGQDWDALTYSQQVDYLSKKADLEIVAYLLKEGRISPDYAKQRVQEIRQR